MKQINTLVEFSVILPKSTVEILNKYGYDYERNIQQMCIKVAKELKRQEMWANDEV